VRNSENGDVELVACGGAQKLDELERWLWQGPAGARVSAVQRSAAPLQVYHGFEVRR
jgi:acylphosphatase